jgi:HK97 family phage portal protein
VRSPLGALLNKAPVPYSGRSGGFGGLFAGGGVQSDPSAQMASMGADGTLFAIVNRTSNAVAQVNWRLYRKARTGKKEDRVEVTAHAALDLWNKPNPFFTRQELAEATQQHVDLTGEGWWVIYRDPRSPLPLELWPVRPDRMTPIPSAETYLAGYVYTGPGGEQVPLGLDDVIFMRMPNPLDPYRGMGPVQTVMVDIGAEKAAAEWNRNFFANSAEPGGIVEIDRRLSQPEFDEHVKRWGEQHRGVSNAHRVALLEGGMKWVERKYTNKDMEFTALRSMSSTKIREAFGMPKFAVGDVGDVNRATAEASKAWFAEQLTVPRLERFKGALNNDLLPFYRDDSLEFDYDNPVPPDEATENATRASKVSAATQLVAAGWDPDEALGAVGLPSMTFVGDDGKSGGGARQLSIAEMVQKLYLGVDAIVTWEEARAMLNAAGAELDLSVPQPEPASLFGAPAAAPATPGRRAPAALALNAAAEDEPETPPEREDWQDRLDELLAAWVAVTAAQRSEIADQIIDVVGRGNLAELADLTVDTTEGAALLEAAMVDQAAAAAERTAADAAEQGVEIEAATIEGEIAADLTAAAAVTAALLGSGLAMFAGREALRVWAPGMSGREVADLVDESLESQSDATLRTELGGEIWAAENEGRFATFALAALAGIVPKFLRADEVRDSATCPACKKIDGKRYLSVAKAEADYPFGGYRDCAGRSRCRGTVVATWL